MVSIVVVSHGGLAKELCASCEMIVGEQQNLHWVTLNPSEGIEEFRGKLRGKLSGLLAQGEVLLLCDLLFGSPFISSTEYVLTGQCGETVRVIAGANLPMLLAAVQACVFERAGLDETANVALEQGVQGISHWLADAEQNQPESDADEII